MMSDLFHAMNSIEARGGTVDEVADLCSSRRSFSKFFFVGNGGSAAIASHMAADWMKNGGFSAMAFNDAPSLTCISNDIGYDQVFALPLMRFGKTGDVLFAVSSSGASPSILSACRRATNLGMTVVTLSGFSPSNPLRDLGNINFYVPSSKYGHVEITHLAVLHSILDKLMDGK